MIGVNSLIPSPFQQNPFSRAPLSFGRGCGCGGSYAGACKCGELGAAFPVAALGQRLETQHRRVATLRAATLRAKPGSRKRHQLEQRLRHAERTLARLTTLWHDARIGNRTRRYGADTPQAVAPAATSDDTAVYATAAGAALKKLTEGSADQTVEVLQAQIKNQSALAKSMPEPLATFYRNNVRVMKAKLKAAKRAKVEEQATTQTKREFLQLGQAGIVTGILVGGALILLLVTKSSQ